MFDTATEQSAARRFLAEAHHPRPGGYRVDPRQLSPVFKRYPDAPRVELPEAGGLSWLRDVNGTTRIRWTRGTAPLGLNGAPPIFAGARPPVIRLAPGRTVPSSGARYPIEMYLATGESDDQPAGLYHYDPAHHVLERLRAGDCRARIGTLLDATAAADPPAAVLVLSTVFWRNCTKYGAFGYRLLCLDAGVVVQQALVVARTVGLAGTVHLGFADDGLGALLGLDPDGENAIAVVTFRGAPGSRPTVEPDWTEPVPAARPPTVGIRANPDLVRVVDLLDASRTRDRSGTIAVTDPRTGDLPLPEAGRLDLASGVHRRRSVHGYRPRPVPHVDLARILAAATAPIDADHPVVTAVGCVAARIDGVEPGAYRYDPRRHGLGRTRAADAFTALVSAALNPILADECRDASLALAPIGDPAAWLAAFGDRGYRMQTITAGMVAQRICLAAAALGLASHVHCDVDMTVLDGALGLTGGPDTSLVLVTVGWPRADRLEPQYPL
jgi:SagB-type dehydrogenase family enzyme